MKMIKLSKKITGSSSLPVLIKLLQYSPKNKDYLKGALGEQYYSYTIDCNNGLLLENEARPSGIEFINNEFDNMRDPMISKIILDEKFYIIEIPDYSHQAMSLGYNDFIVHIFIDNKKIPQKYIGMIKSYTKRVAYILIDKTLTTEITDSTIFDINIIFKQNKEEKTTNIIDLNNQKYIFENKYNYQLIFNEKPATLENYLFTDLVNINLESAVQKQTGDLISTGVAGGSTQIADYFKQVFDINYIASNVYSDLSRVKNINSSKKDNINIYSFQRGYEFINFSGTEYDVSKYYHFDNPEDFDIYNSNGEILAPGVDYKIEGTKITNLDFGNYELVPNFVAARRLSFIIPSSTKVTDDTVRGLLYTAKDYRWNMKNLDYYFITRKPVTRILVYDYFEEVIKIDSEPTPVSEVKYGKSFVIPAFNLANPFLYKYGDANFNEESKELETPFYLFRDDNLNNTYFTVKNEKIELALNNENYGERIAALNTDLDSLETLNNFNNNLTNKLNTLKSNLYLLYPIDNYSENAVDTINIKNRNILFIKIKKEERESIKYTVKGFEIEDNYSVNNNFIILPYWQENNGSNSVEITLDKNYNYEIVGGE